MQRDVDDIGGGLPGEFQRLRDLWTSVLAMAVHDARGGRHVPVTYREDARRWIAETGSRAQNSFESVCEFLDLSPYWVREKLKAANAR